MLPLLTAPRALARWARRRWRGLLSEWLAHRHHGLRTRLSWATDRFK